MALSNWDTFAVDEQSKPTNGCIVSSLGVRVEIYKNWLYVHDDKGWQEGEVYVKDLVAEIREGVLTYKDIHITAHRGPKGGIYVIVETGRDKTRQIMVGIGCYGFVGDEFVGVQQTEIEHLRAMMDEHEDSPLSEGMLKEEVDEHIARIQERRIQIYKESPETARQEAEKGMAEVITSYTFNEDVRRIDLSQGLRFNQGDAYFAKALRFEIPATKAGETQPTILENIIASENPLTAPK